MKLFDMNPSNNPEFENILGLTNTTWDRDNVVVDRAATEGQLLEIVGGSTLNPIYVSPSGSDETGDGTEQKPFRQIQKAIDRASNLIPHSVYAEGGSYDAFIVSPYKCIALYLKGDVTINNSNIERGICAHIFSRIYISSDNESASRNLRIVDCPYSVYSTISSIISITSSISLILVNPGISSAMIGGNTNSLTVLNCSISRSGDPGGTYFFVCDNNSNLVITGTLNNNLGTVNTLNAFAAAGYSSNITIVGNSNFTIGNGYTYGLRANGGTIRCGTLNANNAQTPISQTNGGRVFYGNSTSTTNSVSPVSESEGIDPIEFSENNPPMDDSINP